MNPIEIPNPLPPEKPGLVFVNVWDRTAYEEFCEVNKSGYLVLSYVDGRKLAVYLIEIRDYIKKLKTLIEYYKPNYEEEP